MQRADRQEWAEAYNKEYQGFIEQGTLKIARPEKGAVVLDTTMRADYKMTNGVFASIEEFNKAKCMFDKSKYCVSAATTRSKAFVINLEICMLQSWKVLRWD